MKIVLVINDITGLGGAERVVTLAANNFILEENVEVEILSVFPKRNKEIGFSLHKMVKVTYLNPNGVSGNSIQKIFVYLKKLGSFYTSKKYNYIICCSSSLSILTRIAILKSKTIKSKVISWEHTQHSHLSKNVNRLQRVCYPFLDGIVTLTSFDKDIFSKFCKNVAYIPNISTFKEVEYNSLQSKKVIAVGRLNKAKGFDLLIRSFALVHKENPEWTLDIFGEGILFENLANQIIEEGLTNVIKLRGYESNILRQYQNASIFALSSRTEGFPCVLVEAMSAGLPSVNFELPGFNEVIKNNQNGLLIEPNNIHEFAKGINKLIENKKLRLEIGKNAIESVQQFRGDNIIPKWLHLFKEIEN
jgi:glycosyltransferase involved in cell wall biosynthesis